MSVSLSSIATTYGLFAAILGLDSTSFVEAQVDSGSFVGCPLLLEGQESDCVFILQHYLNAVDDSYDPGESYDVPEDGYFGPATRIAVLDFQGRNDLPADGNVGPETAERLVELVPGTGPPGPAPSVWGDLTSDVLAEQCPEDFAALDDYLSGRVDPPRCFPYQPDLVQMARGQRAVDPFRDGCSGPTDDENLLWDRQLVCGTHDYGYDLLRYGVDTFKEPDVDHYFLQDMLAECAERSNVASEAICKQHAVLWRAGVQEGDVEPGDEIAAG